MLESITIKKIMNNDNIRVADITTEGKYAVITLQSGVRWKIKNWDSLNKIKDNKKNEQS